MSRASFETILVPYDFTPTARHALSVGLDLARRLGAEVHLVHTSRAPTLAVPPGAGIGAAGAYPVVDVSAWERDRREELEQLARELDAPRGGVQAHLLGSGGLSDSICATAAELDADLIVMGTHARSGLAHLLVGSVTERTLRRAPCPVLAVPPEDGSDEDPDDASPLRAGGPERPG